MYVAGYATRVVANLFVTYRPKISEGDQDHQPSETGTHSKPAQVAADWQGCEPETAKDGTDITLPDPDAVGISFIPPYFCS